MRPSGSRWRSISEQIRGGLGTLLVFYIFEAFITGQGVISFLVGWVMVVLGAVDVVRGVGHDPARVREGAITMLAWVALDVAVFGTIYLNNRLARHRADQVIAALDRYRVEHRQYPRRLAELTPHYLSSVPVAKYALMFFWFDYYCKDGETGFLGYTSIPPFGRPTYSLQRKNWSHLD